MNDVIKSFELPEDAQESISPARVFSTTSTSSPRPDLAKAIYPPNPILNDFMDFGRRFSEATDNFILAVALVVISAILARRVWIEFDGKKYPNIYSLLAARPGFRKSTTIKLGEGLLKRLLTADRFSSPCASEEALFDEYDPAEGGSLDKVLIVDEGNSLLANWVNSSYGQIVAKRYLSLYDGRGWRMAFRRNKGSAKKGTVVRDLPETSTSMLLGATYNSATFANLENRDGMKRRFLHYVCDELARTIYVPSGFVGNELDDLLRRFSPLKELEGAVTFTDTGLQRWKELQDDNRSRLQELPEFPDRRQELQAQLLAEEPSHTLKVAMIFAACEVAADMPGTEVRLSPDILDFANQHVRQCLESALFLENISRQFQTRNQSEAILAKIRTDYADRRQAGGDSIVLNKSELTSRFAPHSGRPGSLTPDDLYTRIIPDLIARDLCRLAEKSGKRVSYAFRLEDE